METILRSMSSFRRKNLFLELALHFKENLMKNYVIYYGEPRACISEAIISTNIARSIFFFFHNANQRFLTHWDIFYNLHFCYR